MRLRSHELREHRFGAAQHQDRPSSMRKRARRRDGEAPAEGPSPGNFACTPWHDCCIELFDMTAQKDDSELEISEDMNYQRRTWIVERAGWIVLGATLLAALLGLFGGGGFVASAEVATDSGALSMHYDRFWRVESPTHLRVVVRPAAENDSAVRIWIARDYLEALSLTATTPQPDRVATAADRYVFEFPLADPGEAATIVLDVEPREPGRLRGEIGVEGGDSLSFSQFIYP
jgi:hypothetical protein